VKIECIHDDRTLLGPAGAYFGTANQEGALAYLTQRLKDRGLTINEGKYQFLASSNEARAIILENYAEHQPYINITDPATGLETKYVRHRDLHYQKYAEHQPYINLTDPATGLETKYLRHRDLQCSDRRPTICGESPADQVSAEMQCI
jgi:hypothetical protein